MRAGRLGRPDVREHGTEGLALLGRDHELARVATEHLAARVAGGVLAGPIEADDPSGGVEDADERLRRLDERHTAVFPVFYRRRKGDAVSGWSCLDKPYDLTSTHAVGRVRRIFMTGM